MSQSLDEVLIGRKDAVGLLKGLIMEEYDGRLPMHEYRLSYRTEKLKMSKSEAEERTKTANLFFPNQDWQKPPICEELHEQNSSTLIVSDPSCNLLLFKNKYTIPIDWELYDYLAKKIATNGNLKVTREIKTEPVKTLAHMWYVFSDKVSV